MIKIGIIGGSGLDDPKILENFQEIKLETPYGDPSSIITTGNIFGMDVCILSRHGKNHEITPTNVNNRANIYALKKLGCTHIIATTAVGSLKENIHPGDLVILDQLIDFTKNRKTTFYDDFKQEVKHVSLADPFSKEIREKIIFSCEELNYNFHKNGTVITIEGPRFSTRAESNLFKQFGADVINMSIAPEASLAMEADLKYSAIAMSTDYDCWKNENDVTIEIVFEIMRQNADKVKKVILKTIEKFSQQFKFNEDINYIKSKINTCPNWPKQGVMFRDINSLLNDKEGFAKTIQLFEDRYKKMDIDAIAGIESRGFILASTLADRLKKPLILIRKKGKLPFETIQQDYSLEYGTSTIEIQKNAISQNNKVLILDDLIATGGTAIASCQLIEKAGGKVVECGFIIDLPELKGKQKLQENGFNSFNLIDFQGE